ncbi:hypothetical protein ONA91_29710 [Micromonospora sp. DR5-3]|uniref:hypothetical protein n=1 Tax=unclassified Micromonospora TaxID=2617518 RepID=UPI0011D7500A|nr:MULTISPECIES: hypothetical protein [unclassified Micromonospora]MCW3818623.1 hypothetical protein [Micromonospora sp. DR5-3]TYC19787.1 hypothetical protein FXF52_34845 [Micromonospora sp. MP36]
MKTAGALTMIVGIIAGIVLFLLPAKVSVLGTSISCAPPVIQLVAPDTGSVDDTFTAAVVQDCKSQSVVRSFLGLVVLAISIGGGAIMLVVGGDKRSEPQWAWDGNRWVNRA